MNGATEKNATDQPRRLVAHRLVPVAAMIALLGIALLIFEFGRTVDLTGYLFLFVIPFSLGGLAISAGRGDGREKLVFGCLIAPILIAAAALLAVEFLHEGFVCIAMVAVPWSIAGLGGMAVNSWFGWMRRRWEKGRPTFYSIGWLTLPLLCALAIEPADRDDWRTVSRSVILDASPDEAWPMILSIERVRTDEGQWNFTQDLIRIPRPISAQLATRDGRLVRLASWGDDIRFEEEITHLRPHREIRWAFRFPDRSISIRTDRHIHPNSELLTIQAGGYRLDPLGNGRTRLTLWTRYRQKVRVPGYTAWWGERFLGDIQSNILTIIRDRAA